ncbi:MAG: helix-turn-helix transcriptional regulator [Staphylococcus simulans]|uniref:helix-turn-helix domain-containing protein n=1 Tax=Staphylococcus simulans TaxID=1286 RepID=UPI000D1EEDE4|nr:helix-turn-helix transcriptional regulator [Staphylococcus simulans]MDN6657393.1 helix-turn-helix transcriptional regulator [Staphylococcus simulans]PTI93417.1 transcriptional regulator [Staphylococcus simulans]PTJ02225.1 transcriptional regulator [Staphylococcus simulans]PTJ38202.1 transcriptional regulator [Staphylococcus simulans]PTJ97151.1 transcriptional regulator [Staphylococcus simulans]
MKFGQNIKQIRKQRNLTQKQLADQIEISRSYLSDIENGRKNLSIKTVKKLADSLGLSVTDLFNDDTTF